MMDDAEEEWNWHWPVTGVFVLGYLFGIVTGYLLGAA